MQFGFSGKFGRFMPISHSVQAVQFLQFHRPVVQSRAVRVSKIKYILYV